MLRTADADAAAGADGLVLPGVGAFPKAMARVRELGFDRLIEARAGEGTPVEEGTPGVVEATPVAASRRR